VLQGDKVSSNGEAGLSSAPLLHGEPAWNFPICREVFHNDTVFPGRSTLSVPPFICSLPRQTGCRRPRQLHSFKALTLWTSIFILIQSFMRTVSCAAGMLSGCGSRFSQAKTSPRLRARGGGSDAPRGEVLPAPRGLLRSALEVKRGRCSG
jgi:hypothetical protein